MNLVVDTSVIIGHLRGDAACSGFLESQARTGADLGVSAVTWAEVLAESHLDEEAEAVAIRLLRSLRTLPVTVAIATQAGRLVRAWRRSHGLGLPDAFIAASALEHDSPLVTLDQRHFGCVPGLVVLAPYAPQA